MEQATASDAVMDALSMLAWFQMNSEVGKLSASEARVASGITRAATSSVTARRAWKDIWEEMLGADTSLSDIGGLVEDWLIADRLGTVWSLLGDFDAGSAEGKFIRHWAVLYAPVVGDAPGERSRQREAHRVAKRWLADNAADLAVNDVIVGLWESGKTSALGARSIAGRTPLYVEEPVDDSSGTALDIGQIVWKKESADLAQTGPYDALTREELMDRIDHYKDVAFIFKHRARWLRRRLETLCDVVDDEYGPLAAEQECTAGLERMLAAADGSMAKVRETMAVRYGGAEAQRLRRHYPRKWNAVRSALIRFFGQDGKEGYVIDEWKAVGEPLDLDSEYATTEVLSYPIPGDKAD